MSTTAALNLTLFLILVGLFAATFAPSPDPARKASGPWLATAFFVGLASSGLGYLLIGDDIAGLPPQRLRRPCDHVRGHRPDRAQRYAPGASLADRAGGMCRHPGTAARLVRARGDPLWPCRRVPYLVMMRAVPLERPWERLLRPLQAGAGRRATLHDSWSSPWVSSLLPSREPHVPEGARKAYMSQPEPST